MTISRMAATTLGALVVLAIATPPAQWQDSHWTLRGFSHALDSGDDRVGTVPAPGSSSAFLEAAGGGGFGAEVEYRLSDLLGIELGAFIGELDTDLTLQHGSMRRVSEDFAFEMVSVGANYHFTPGRRADVYAGVLVGSVSDGDIVYALDAMTNHTLRFDDDFGFGFRAGIDVPIKEDGARDVAGVPGRSLCAIHDWCYQPSTAGRFFPSRGGGGRTERSIPATQVRDSAGSMVSSTANCDAWLSALPAS